MNRDLLFSYAAMGTHAVTMIVLSVALAWILGLQELGYYALARSLIGLSNILILPGFDSVVSVAAAKNYVGSFRQLLEMKLNNPLFLFYGTSHIEGYMKGLGMFQEFFYLKIISSAVLFIVTIGLALSGAGGIIIGLVFMALPNAINLLYSVLNYPVFFSKNYFPQMERNGKSFNLNRIISTISGEVDKLLIGLFLGVESLAIYHIIIGVAGNVKSLLSPITSYMLAKHEKQPGIYERNWLKVSGAFTLLVGLFCIGSPAILWVYGQAYFAYWPLLALLLLSLIPATLVEVFNKVKCYGSLDLNMIRKLEIGNAIVKILSTFLVIPFGLLGGVASFWVARCFTLMLMFVRDTNEDLDELHAQLRGDL